MKRYRIDRLVSDNNNSVVYLGYAKEGIQHVTNPGQPVAIKKVKKKFFDWSEIMSIREVDSLRRITHPNLVKLREVIKEADDLYLIFDPIEATLAEVKDKFVGLGEEGIKHVFGHMVSGVAALHKKGIMHRNLCPENIYLRNHGKEALVGGFSMSKFVPKAPATLSSGMMMGAESEIYRHTEYIGSRPYRSPEQLLKLPYSYAADVFSLGVLFVELIIGRQLFLCGSEIDQMHAIIGLMGYDELHDWPEGREKFSQLGFIPNPARAGGKKISSLLPDEVSQEGLVLIDKMLRLNPQERIRCADILTDPFFMPSEMKHRRKRGGKYVDSLIGVGKEPDDIFAEEETYKDSVKEGTDPIDDIEGGGEGSGQDASLLPGNK